MKTLYVSDLDGTLLSSDERLSITAQKALEELTNQGLLFSYATARSYITAMKVTQGFHAQIPLIVYNGAMIAENDTGKILALHYLKDAHELLTDLLAHEIAPIVYTIIDGLEQFRYVADQCSMQEKTFLQTRKEDPRNTPLTDPQDLFAGDIFYISCIDDEEKLQPFVQKYQDQYHIIYQKDVYTQDQWLEFMPLNTSKAKAVHQLKQLMQCDRTVVFGDGINDIEMFQEADECYAVENAVDELKNLADGIIESNDADGVVKWLMEHYKRP